MRKIYTVVLIGTLTFTLLGCQKQPEEMPNSYLEKAESEVVEEIKESDFSSEESNSEEYIPLKYENNNISFEYSNTWELKELQHEDGNEISFWNSEGKKVLWIDRGEAWRVNLEMTEEDNGRFKQTKDDRDKHRFKVPGLRNIALTAPYFHDGSMKTMKEAVDYMAKYQMNLDLPEDELNKIVSFLETLTGEYKGKLLTNDNFKEL